MGHDGRPELGEFLRHRRAQMTPPDRPGNLRSSVRRVPGLRRQELSDVAGISVEYYTRLEQGRAPRPSREILSALGRAFQLSTAENHHLFRLAGELPPRPRAPATHIGRVSSKCWTAWTTPCRSPFTTAGSTCWRSTLPRRICSGPSSATAIRPQHRLPGLHVDGTPQGPRERRGRAVGTSGRCRASQSTECLPGR